MTQVQLKIEEFFDKTIVFEIKEYNENNYLHEEISDIINSKLDPIQRFKFLPNESRETIIKALEDYQQSLLPEVYYLKKIEASKNINIYDSRNFIYVADFYEHNTRIITITKWDNL